METGELASLFSKIGATSEADKQLIFELHNTLFNYGIPGENNGYSSSSIIIISPPIIAFRSQFRKHVRCNPFKYLSASKLAAATRDAEAEFNKALARLASTYPAALAGGMIESTRAQMKEERAWIDKINGWKRADFLETNLEQAVSKFKDRLWNADYFLNNVSTTMSSSEEIPAAGGIQHFGARLSSELAEELAGAIPSFEESSEVENWVGQLRAQCSQIVSQGEASEQKISEALNQYKTRMSEYLARHRFANDEKVEVAHAQALSGIEAEPAFVHHILDDRVLKSVWHNKILDEYYHLEKGWREEGASRIKAIRGGMKSHCEKMIKENQPAANNFPLDSSIQLELEALFSPDFDNVLRRILKKVEKVNLTEEHAIVTPAGKGNNSNTTTTTSEEVDTTPTGRLEKPEARVIGRKVVRSDDDVTPAPSTSSVHKKKTWFTARKYYHPIHERQQQSPPH